MIASDYVRPLHSFELCPKEQSNCLCTLITLCAGHVGNEDADRWRLADLLRFRKPVPYPARLPEIGRRRERRDGCGIGDAGGRW